MLDKKYFKTDTIHRTLLPIAEDPANNIVSCGFLQWEHKSNIVRNINFKYYGGLYVISGTGKYIDADTGKEYPVSPGCIVQRMPRVRHHFEIDLDSNWLEFYFCAGQKIFETLASMKLISDSPVFYAGESTDIYHRLIEYLDLFKRTDDYHAAQLLPEFQKLLFYFNHYKQRREKREWLNIIAEKLQNNYGVGISLKDLVSDCGISYENLRKQFSEIYGCSLEQYRIQLRINAAKRMLLDQNMSIKEVAYELGYCDTYAFCKQFKQQVGIPPGKFIETG